MKEKPFYQCEHCLHYVQHYNISEDRIYKVACGHCKCKDKNLKPSLRDCRFFEQRVEENENKEIHENVLNILKQVEKTIKYFKLYLNKNQDGQKIDNCLKDMIK